jgi:hypothetical protein
MNGINALKKEILEISYFMNVFSLLLCFGGYIVTFIKLLTIYKLYHT